MMPSSLASTDQEIIECFLNTFQILSVKQQRIWDLLRWYATHHRNVFPSHETIAKQVGCCRDTVIQAIKKFADYGWLTIQKRCFRSCLYFLNGILKKIDTKKKEVFQLNPTVNPTVNPTLYTCNLSQEKKRTDKQVEIVQSLRDEKEQILQEMGITYSRDVWCLCRFSLKVLRLAFEDFKTRKADSPIRRIAAWITNRCQDNLKKYGG